MTTTNKMRSAIASLYGAAVLVSIFAGGLIWVVIVGAIVTSIAYRLTAGPRSPGRDRQRNRQRNRR